MDYFWSVLLCSIVSFVLCNPQQPTGPGNTKSGQGNDQEDGECPATDKRCNDCTWMSQEGVWYTLKDFTNRQFQVGLPNPRGSMLKFHLCFTSGPQISCQNGIKSPACITVPGVKPTSTGMELRIEQLEPNIPSMGMKLIYEQGEICEVTKLPRMTIIKLPCSHEAHYSAQNFYPRQSWEGQNKEVCHYFVDFPPSKFGCPNMADTGQQILDQTVSITSRDGAEENTANSLTKYIPKIWAVTGCQDSNPSKTTEDCHFAGKIRLILHGTNFHSLCSSDTQPNSISTSCKNDFNSQFSVYIGSVECSEIALVSPYQINCTLENGAGKEQDVSIKRKSLSSVSDTDVSEGEEVVAVLRSAVSFKERINYHERFSKFVEMGVGGLKREINELYRRAFASRGTSSELLEQLGIGHVKGILFYGPPGSGKTLLARTIGKMLGSKQVSLINGPEIISKYLGESEKNLRSQFKEAHKNWEEFGLLSDLFVIIIDEIDAICKPRGKTDQSAAGVAYDALVNQLLTLMDGLNEVHNTLVIGLTNRRELLDPALLRPGRFEVQIEVTLPDEEGRREIFEIHTREMKKNGLLGADVNVFELATNTSRFSGAEIAGVVRSASSYALERYQLQIGSNPKSVVVTSSDFSRAIREINPAYTHSETHILTNFLPLGYLSCGEAHASVIDAVLDTIHVLVTSSATRLRTVLLHGPRGSGKTTLAAHLAMMGKFSFVKILTASSLVGVHDAMKVDILYQTFNDAFKSETAIIILDDLHRLVEYVQVGNQIQVSHSLLHTLFTTTHPSSTKLMVIGTMTTVDEVALDDPSTLGLPKLFTQHQLVPLLGPDEARNIHRFDGVHFSLPGNLAISVEQLVHAIDCVCS